MNSDPIPLVDLRAQYAEIREEVEGDLLRVLSDACYIQGPDVSAFEQEYADFVGVRHCVGVANGTDAVEIALLASGVRSGDEVILPANTFIATAEAVCRLGAVPVLADVLPDTLLIDPDSVQAVRTRRTRAVVPVHLFGQVARVEELEELVNDGIAIVEDAAQAQGATRNGRVAGSLGQAAATSFYPGKNLGAAGDAGALTTSDDGVARAARLLASHGSQTKYEHDVVGFNSRLDTLQAVILRHKLRRLSEWNDRRRSAAARYGKLLRGLDRVELPTVDPSGVPVWHLYVVQVACRGEVLARLHEAGIGAGIHYPTPLHKTRAFRALGGVGDFPVAERASDRILSLPMYPHLTEQQQIRVAEALTAAPGTRASA